jgi:hypothetical protein
MRGMHGGQPVHDRSGEGVLRGRFVHGLQHGRRDRLLARTDGKTTCATTGTATGQCVACVADAQCTTDPTKGFCVANTCTGCNTTGATGCSTRTDGKIVCATTGTSRWSVRGVCDGCQCTTDPTKGFCVANACTGCNAAGATGCAARTDGKTTCATTGTAAGQCVECTADSQCTANPSKGFCVANACTGATRPERPDVLRARMARTCALDRNPCRAVRSLRIQQRLQGRDESDLYLEPVRRVHGRQPVLGEARCDREPRRVHEQHRRSLRNGRGDGVRAERGRDLHGQRNRARARRRRRSVRLSSG